MSLRRRQPGPIFEKIPLRFVPQGTFGPLEVIAVSYSYFSVTRWALASLVGLVSLGSGFVRAAPVPRAASSVRETRAQVLSAMDQALETGKISWQKHQFLKVAALRDPSQLPDDWRRRFMAASRSAGCFTPVLVDAFKALPRMDDSWRRKVSRLLMPRQDLAYTIDATDPFPVRVSYGDPSLESTAQTVLDSIEEAYRVEVDQWGFWAPPIEPGLEYFRVFVEDAGPGAGGYTASYRENPATAHRDAFTYIVIGPNNDDWLLPAVVAHEFNHACQAAMDAYEVTAFWENTATYIMSQVFPAGWPYTMWTFRDFQRYPYRTLEYMNRLNSDGYEYGGALWLYTMEYLYGDEDPRWIRRVWEGSVQDVPYNEPDYFDVLSDMLASQGGFQEMVRTFARYRYFASSDDDGRHVRDAGGWYQAEVAKETRYGTTNLPVLNAAPQEAHRPMPNGCNYIELYVDQTPGLRLRYRFSGDPALLWSAEVMKLHMGADAAVTTIDLDDNETGQAEVQVDQGDRLVLVVCQLGPEDYDPDTSAKVAGDYQYSIDWAAPVPTVTEVMPSELPRGSQETELLIRGKDFVLGSGFGVKFGQDKVVANRVAYMSDTEVRAWVVVAKTADLGPTDVIVVNPGNQEGVGHDLLSIVAEQGAGDAGPGSDIAPGEGRGCGCRLGGRSDRDLSWVFVALALGLLWRRMRRI